MVAGGFIFLEDGWICACQLSLWRLSATAFCHPVPDTYTTKKRQSFPKYKAAAGVLQILENARISHERLFLCIFFHRKSCIWITPPALGTDNIHYYLAIRSNSRWRGYIGRWICTPPHPAANDMVPSAAGITITLPLQLPLKYASASEGGLHIVAHGSAVGTATFIIVLKVHGTVFWRVSSFFFQNLRLEYRTRITAGLAGSRCCY